MTRACVTYTQHKGESILKSGFEAALGPESGSLRRASGK